MKESTNSIFQNKNLLLLLLQNSSDLIISLGKDFSVTLLNKTSEQFYNWSLTAVQGKSFIELCKTNQFICPINSNYFKHPTVYVGTIKMKMACQYFERYWKSGKRDQLEPLYQQAVKVIEDSFKEIKNWLKQKQEKN